MALIRTAFDTAVRIGALLKIPDSAYDENTRELFVDASYQKGKADTRHEVSTETHEAIQAMRQTELSQATDELFAWPFHWQYVWKAFRRQVLIPAGLPHGRRDMFHKIRRTSYTFVAAELGVDAATRHAAHQSNLSHAYLDRSKLHERSALSALPRLTAGTESR